VHRFDAITEIAHTHKIGGFIRTANGAINNMATFIIFEGNISLANYTHPPIAVIDDFPKYAPRGALYTSLGQDASFCMS
jgi:hypothetical protein